MSDIIFCLNSATLKTSLHVGMVAVSLWTKNVMNEKIALMGVMKILATSLSRKKQVKPGFTNYQPRFSQFFIRKK